MTLGERIASVRKENQLSQESFGEVLGVSRQAISKWEANQSIPDVEKIILLCKTYEVSIAWLLDIDDGEAASDEQHEGDSIGIDLTDTQSQMVQEIVHQYLDASQSRKHENVKHEHVKQGIIACMAVMMGALLIWCSRLNNKIMSVQNANSELNQSLNNLQYSVGSQISDITAQVQQSLEEGTSILADYNVSEIKTDYRNNVFSCNVNCVPKVYVDGMSVRFTLDNGMEPITVESIDDGNHRFSANLDGKMSDHMTITAILSTDEKEEMKQIESYEYMISDSYPYSDGGGMEMYFAGMSTKELAKNGPQELDVSFSCANSLMDKSPISAKNVNYIVKVNGKEKTRYSISFGEYAAYNSSGSVPVDAEFAKNLKDGDEVTIALQMEDTVGRTFIAQTEKYQIQDGIFNYLGIISGVEIE